MKAIETKHNINLENLSVNEFRQRCFVKRSEALYGKDKSPYTYGDDLPKQIESMEGFSNWESFSITWDIYWVGLDPRNMSWVAGRHNSPIRKLVTPLQIVAKDERTNRMVETHFDKSLVRKIPTPEQKFQESDGDRAISEALTGKVVVDEPDHDKAIRLIEKNMKMLQEQLAVLTR